MYIYIHVIRFEYYLSLKGKLQININYLYSIQITIFFSLQNKLNFSYFILGLFFEFMIKKGLFFEFRQKKGPFFEFFLNKI